MSATITASANQKIIPLSRGKMYFGTAAFVTSGVTVEVAVPFKNLESWSFGFGGTPASTDGPLSIDETIANDQIAVSGTVTVTRPAGTTSGQKFSFIFIGH